MFAGLNGFAHLFEKCELVARSNSYRQRSSAYLGRSQMISIML